MRIKKVLWENGREIMVALICQHCALEYEVTASDSSHFRQTVVPEMTCPRCKRKASVGKSSETRDRKHKEI